MAVTKVHGGIVTDQMLAGSLAHFKITGATFGATLSDGTINLNLSTSGGDPVATTYFVVGEGKPVPDSAAELVLRVILSKCTIVQLGLDDEFATTEIHLAIENSSIGWIDANADIDVAQMQTAIRALGTVTVPASIGVVPDATAVPVTADIDLSAVIVENVPYQLV